MLKDMLKGILKDILKGILKDIRKGNASTNPLNGGDSGRVGGDFRLAFSEIEETGFRHPSLGGCHSGGRSLRRRLGVAVALSEGGWVSLSLSEGGCLSLSLSEGGCFDSLCEMDAEDANGRFKGGLREI